MFVNNTLSIFYRNVIDCINALPSSSVVSVYFIDALLLINQLNRLPPELVKFLTDPNYTEAPDMEMLYPFVESALPLAYGVLGVLLFHVSIHLYHYFLVFVYIVAIQFKFVYFFSIMKNWNEFSEHNL